MSSTRNADSRVPPDSPDTSSFRDPKYRSGLPTIVNVQLHRGRSCANRASPLPPFRTKRAESEGGSFSHFHVTFLTQPLQILRLDAIVRQDKIAARERAEMIQRFGADLAAIHHQNALASGLQ